MKNNYCKHPEAFEDERPIPEPDDRLFNNPDEDNALTFNMKVKPFVKCKKTQNNEK